MTETGRRPGETLRVGYILKMFPRLSETFILNEILELERQGVDVSVFSLMHPNDGRFHGRLSQLRLGVEYHPSDRPEAYWNAIRSLDPDEVVGFDRWNEAAEFLRRHSIPRDLEFLLRAVLIASRVKRQGIRHLHAHFATIATRMAAVVGMLTGVPFSFTCHAKDIFRKTVNRELFAELTDRAEFTITVSDFNRRFILEATPDVDANRLFRLYNGIDLGFFPERGPRRGNGVPHIVSVGRLVPKKGFDHLLRALGRCKQDGLRFRATVIGDGEQQANLLALRDQLDLSGEVAFPGGLAQEQVREIVSGASLMALACVPDDDGNMDALPTVLLEALALDLPIVSTRLTGIPEIVGDGTGVLVDPGDDERLADAIRTTADRIHSGAYTNRAGRARAEKLFDLTTNVSTLVGMFGKSARRERCA